jgi:hypothetical protein
MVEIIEEKIFTINKNFKVYEKFIGQFNNKIIIIDNFFSFPNQVRDYALSCKYVKEGGHSNPGYVHRTGVNLFHFLDFTTWVKEFYYQDYRVNQNPPIFSFQAYDKIGEVLPHIDEVNYAGLCCLNLNEELLDNISGTSFYRYRTGEEYSKQHSYRNNIFNNSSKADWEQYHIEYHKYNRFIFYESSLFHSAYWDEIRWNSEDPRLTFNTFTW